MHVKAKSIAFCGLMLALSVIFMVLGSMIETSTLFLLAAASFFVGIVIREYKMGMGTAFWLAAVLLGFILAPNKLYVITFAAMGLYVLVIEFAFLKLGKYKGNINRKVIFWIIKYAVFNMIYIPVVVGFQKILFSRELPLGMLVGILAAGQAGIWLYDRAYVYMQAHIWNRMRGRIMS